MRKTILWGVSMLFGVIAFGSGLGSNNAQTALTVAISSPTVDVFIKASVTIQVVVTGEPNTVELLKNGAVLATLTTPYQYTWDTISELQGVYTLSARALKKGVTAPVVSAGKKVTVDRTAPTITARAPANGAKNVFLKDEINLVFSEPILPSSVTASNTRLQIGSTTLASTAALNAAGTKLVLRPTALPALPAAISIVVNGLTDRAGNTLVASNTSFTTPDWQQPGTQPLNVNSRINMDTTQRSLALDSSGNPVVAWSERDGGSASIYVKRWNGKAWQQVGTTFLDATTNQNAFAPSMALDSSGNPVVAWHESDGTSFNIYVKRWDGKAWRLVGTTSLDINKKLVADSASLALDLRGNPVVAWREIDEFSQDVYVKRWNGKAWQQMGKTSLNINTDQDAFNPSIALDSSGNPVVSWSEDDSFSANLYVKRWNGTAWQQVGTTFLDVDINQNTFISSLALDSRGNPVIAWSESGNIHVKRWDGTAWQQVGTTSLDINTNQDAYLPSMALDSSGNPVVAWSEKDDGTDNIYVKRWNGTAWQQVGTTFLKTKTNRSAYFPSIALDSRGSPSVAWWEDDGTSDTIYVKRFNRIP